MLPLVSRCAYWTLPARPTHSYLTTDPSRYDSPLAGSEARTIVGRSVFGKDTRQRDYPTTTYPRRVFGAIHSPTSDWHYCSGAKVGPRHFLTAGHCMFNKDTKKWIPNARIWFGQNGDGAGLPPPASQAPFGTLDPLSLVALYLLCL